MRVLISTLIASASARASRCWEAFLYAWNHEV